jgi:hypothetical protein
MHEKHGLVHEIYLGLFSRQIDFFQGVADFSVYSWPKLERVNGTQNPYTSRRGPKNPGHEDHPTMSCRNMDAGPKNPTPQGLDLKIQGMRTIR